MSMVAMQYSTYTMTKPTRCSYTSRQDMNLLFLLTIPPNTSIPFTILTQPTPVTPRQVVDTSKSRAITIDSHYPCTKACSVALLQANTQDKLHFVHIITYIPAKSIAWQPLKNKTNALRTRHYYFHQLIRHWPVSDCAGRRDTAIGEKEQHGSTTKQ